MSTQLLYQTENNSAGWLGAIQDAKSQLETAGKDRAVTLEAVIAVFTEKMNSGEPWPGTKKAEKADALSA